MSRSLKKGPFVAERLVARVKALRPGDKTVLKTWSRTSAITPEMVGFVIGVHNGKDFVNVRVVENMVGHKLGEFSPTRKFVRHGGKIQKAVESAEGAAPAAAATPASAPAKGGKK